MPHGNSPPGVRVDESLQRRLVCVLAGAAGLLIALSLIGTYLRFVLDHDNLLGWIPLFNLDAEGNVSTWFSSILLTLCGVLGGLVTVIKFQRNDQFRREWMALSLLFLGMSLDETAAIHETIMTTMRHFRTTHGPFFFAWVIPGLIFVLGFGAATFRFWLKLPRRFRVLFMTSAVIYFGGAIGFEMLDGNYADGHGQNNLTYALLTTVEESLEMFGSILFISAFLKYIRALGVDTVVRQEWPDRTADAFDPALITSPLGDAAAVSDLRAVR